MTIDKDLLIGFIENHYPFGKSHGESVKSPSDPTSYIIMIERIAQARDHCDRFY